MLMHSWNRKRAISMVDQLIIQDWFPSCHPRNMCVCYRMMYWSVIGDHSHIEESAMDGSMRRVLLDKKLRRPTGIIYFWTLQ